MPTPWIRAAAPAPRLPDVTRGGAKRTPLHDSLTPKACRTTGMSVRRWPAPSVQAAVQVQATTDAGVAGLRAQDGANAAQVQAVGQSVAPVPLAPGRVCLPR